MADISITAASVVGDDGYTFQDVVAGATITAGQPVYLDASDSNKAKLADSDANANTAKAVGLALHAALAGQPLKIITGGKVTLGASPLTQGLPYFLSNTAGAICPLGDLGSADWTTLLGVAETSAKLQLKIWPTGVVQ